MTGGDLNGVGPWFVLLFGRKDLLFHNRNICDCFLTRKGEHLLKALDVLVASDEFSLWFQNTVADSEGSVTNE